MTTRDGDKITNDAAKAAIEKPARRRWKHGEERRHGQHRSSPIDHSQPGPERQVTAGNPEAERSKRQDQKRCGKPKALHERIGDACSPAPQPIMRLRQGRVTGARIPVGPADQGKPAGSRDTDKRSAQQPPRQTAQFDRERLRQKPCPPRLHPRTPPHSSLSSQQDRREPVQCFPRYVERVYEREPGIILRRIDPAGVGLSQISTGKDFDTVSFPNGFRGAFTSTKI